MYHTSEAPYSAAGVLVSGGTLHPWNLVGNVQGKSWKFLEGFPPGNENHYTPEV